MIHVEIIAVGRLRKGPMLDLWKNYEKRLGKSLVLHEIEAKSPQKEEQALLDKISPQTFLIAMDERGKSLSSRDFAKKMEALALEGRASATFVIGGADGMPQSIRDRADFILSFGEQTWPHMLARIMLIEQIYRARQILAGHPYHRD